MATIIGFYHESDIETPQIKNKNHETERPNNNSGYSWKKSYQKSIKNSNIKYKAIILLMSSSGMGSC